MIVACIGMYGERVEQALVGIKKLRPNIDRYVCIVDESVTEEQKEQLKEIGCEVYFHPWEDSMVKMRNQYLEKCQTGDWIVVHDPDEVFNDHFCSSVRALCNEGTLKGVDVFLINSHDTQYNADGTTSEGISDFFKNLIFLNKEGTRYEGVGEIKEVHETLIIPGLAKAVRLAPESFWYDHIKYWHEVWERAARNLFMAGGGNNSGERNPSWRPLRDICDTLGLDNWPKARDYFRKGRIDPQLKQWLWDNRFEGFDYDHEEMEFGRWYFEYLHPEERGAWAPITVIEPGSPQEIMMFVEKAYLKVLGRHADQAGKDTYTKSILEGKTNREALEPMLMQSREYQDKVQKLMGETELMKIQVPIDVSVKITETLILQAMIRSKIWWTNIKPKMDVGGFLALALQENWVDFTVWFYETQPGLKQFIQKLGEYLQ